MTLQKKPKNGSRFWKTKMKLKLNQTSVYGYTHTHPFLIFFSHFVYNPQNF